MRERFRVIAGILLWVGVLLCFIVAGFSVLFNREDDTTPHASEQKVAEEYIERATPESVGLDGDHLRHIAARVEECIDNGTFTGSVVAIVRGDKLAYIEAFGTREQGGEAMSTDTRFDLASLTKPIATAVAVMQLVESGKLRLNQRVSDITPEFKEYRDTKTKELIPTTIGDLMTHTSGLRPYVALSRLEEDYADRETLDQSVMIDYIANSERLGAPRSICKYSCLNYILLGVIVERCSGMSLDEYTQKHIYEPLNMRNTRFKPDAEYAQRTAPTSPAGAEEELRGVVNDPLAREVMAGVSGNAGLFSTAEDLAIYAAMILNGGEWRDAKVLTPIAVEMLFAKPTEIECQRTLAWEELLPEVESEALSPAVYNHNGATGTSISIDRERDMAIIILTNRTHAEGKAKDLMALRSSIRAIATYAIIGDAE